MVEGSERYGDDGREGGRERERVIGKKVRTVTAEAGSENTYFVP
jgi:hypothetical protein